MDTKIYSTPSLRYKNYHWELRLDIPISYHKYHLNYKKEGEKENIHRVYIEPLFNVTYELNAYWKLINAINLAIKYRISITSIQTIYSQTIEMPLTVAAFMIPDRLFTISFLNSTIQ